MILLVPYMFIGSNFVEGGNPPARPGPLLKKDPMVVVVGEGGEGGKNKIRGWGGGVPPLSPPLHLYIGGGLKQSITIVSYT
jgi:hypothetical protein